MFLTQLVLECVPRPRIHRIAFFLQVGPKRGLKSEWQLSSDAIVMTCSVIVKAGLGSEARSTRSWHMTQEHTVTSHGVAPLQQTRRSVLFARRKDVLCHQRVGGAPECGHGHGAAAAVPRRRRAAGPASGSAKERRWQCQRQEAEAGPGAVQNLMQVQST